MSPSHTTPGPATQPMIAFILSLLKGGHELIERVVRRLLQWTGPRWLRPLLAQAPWHADDDEDTPHPTAIYTREPDRWAHAECPHVDTSSIEPARQPVSLISTVLDEADTIRTWLQSLAKQTRMPEELVVVDGGSRDGTADVIESLGSELPFTVRVIRIDGVNIARGRNLAIEAARHDLIACTDAGTMLQPDWLEQIVRPLEHDEAVDVVAGWYAYHFPSTAEAPLPRYDFLLRADLSTVDPTRFLPSARSLAVRRRTVETSGGFPEFLTRCGEDTLWGLTLARVGHLFAFAPEAVARWHFPPTWEAVRRTLRGYSFGDGEARIRQVAYAKRVLWRTTALLLAGTGVALLLAAAVAHWLAGGLPGWILLAGAAAALLLAGSHALFSPVGQEYLLASIEARRNGQGRFWSRLATYWAAAAVCTKGYLDGLRSAWRRKLPSETRADGDFT